MTDTSIGVPTARADATSGEEGEEEADDSIVSVHVHGGAGWAEERLVPGEAMDIQLPDGRTVAIIEVDHDSDTGRE